MHSQLALARLWLTVVAVSLSPQVFAACGSERLLPNATLTANQRLTSCSEKYTLVMQGDGNLVVYDSSSRAGWNLTAEPVRPAYVANSYAVMQGDGNFVVATSSGQPVWSTNTYALNGASLRLTDAGEVVVEKDNYVFWSSNGGLSRGDRTYSTSFGENRDEAFVSAVYRQLLDAEISAGDLSAAVTAIRQNHVSPSVTVANIVAGQAFANKHAKVLSDYGRRGVAWLLYQRLLRRNAPNFPCDPPTGQVACSDLNLWVGNDNRDLSANALAEMALSFIATPEFRNAQLLNLDSNGYPALLAPRVYCGIGDGNRTDINTAGHLMACLNLVAPGGLVLLAPAKYFLGDSMRLPVTFRSVTIATAGMQNVRDQEPCAANDADYQGSRCAILVARPDFVYGYMVITEARGLRFLYLAIDGNGLARRQRNAVKYQHPLIDNFSIANASMRHCHECVFQGFTSMRAPAHAGLIFSGNDASFLRCRFRDNGFSFNRAGEPANRIELPLANNDARAVANYRQTVLRQPIAATVTIDALAEAHADGLAIEYGDRLNVLGSYFLRNTDAHLAVFQARGGRVALNQFLNQPEKPGDPAVMTFTAIDLESGVKTDDKVTPPWPAPGNYGDPAGNPLTIEGNYIGGGAAQSIAVGVNVGSYLWYKSPLHFGGAIVGNTIEDARIGILLNKTQRTKVARNRLINIGYRRAMVATPSGPQACVQSPVVFVDAVDVDYPNDGYRIEPTSGWRNDEPKLAPRCDVGQLFRTEFFAQ